MIRLSAEFLFMCAITSAHPTVFIDDDSGECVAFCKEYSIEPHTCFMDGHSLTDCYSDDGQSQLCDAYIHMITTDDYEVIQQNNQ